MRAQKGAGCEFSSVLLPLAALAFCSEPDLQTSEESSCTQVSSPIANEHLLRGPASARLSNLGAKAIMRIALASTLVLAAFSLAPQPLTRRTDACLTRRSLGGLLPAIVAPALVALPSQTALAADLKKDCIKDCVSNCNRVAPGNKAYCAVQCEDYCAQDDRKETSEGN